MLLSSEFLGLLEKEVWEGVLKPSLERWDITITMGYRRFYTWAPSVWFQIMRKRTVLEWPKNEHDMKLQIPAFRDWYNSTDGVRFLDKLYTDSYIDHWRGLDIKNFLIYNMHEDPKLLKTGRSR